MGYIITRTRRHVKIMPNTTVEYLMNEVSKKDTIQEEGRFH